MRRQVQPAVLNKIPIVEWVRGVAKKMETAATEERADWNESWATTYEELGGKQRTIATKGCPMAAAYGLWYLGLLASTSRPAKAWDIPRVDHELGKNAAYAVITLELLKPGPAPTLSTLWQQVKSRYREVTGEEPAENEQGEIRLVVGLFTSGQLRASGEVE
jgi:hypothetical protein